MLCLKNRLCVLGGEHADIADYCDVSAGRNQKKINHVCNYIMTICREHHTEQQKMGIKSFFMKYHIKPIKVTEDIAKQLNLGVISNVRQASNRKSSEENEI